MLRPGSLQPTTPPPTPPPPVCAPLPSPHPPALDGTHWTLHPSPPQCGINTFRAAAQTADAPFAAERRAATLRRTRANIPSPSGAGYAETNVKRWI